MDPRAEATLWIARRRLEQAGEASALAASLSAIVGTEVRLFRRAVRQSVAGNWLRLGFRVHGATDHFVIGLEPALAAALLSGLLRRPAPLLAPGVALDETTAGALSAILIEAARASHAPHALRPAEPTEPEHCVALSVTALVGDKPYAAVVWASARPSAPSTYDDNASLRALGDVQIQLPLVVALGLATPRTLVGLCVGAAFCPGSETWIDAKGEGRGVLVAGNSERGVAVELGPQGKIVLRHAQRVPLTSAEETSMQSDETAGPPTLAQAVLDAPLVVRVELGSVSMAAREWAALRAGDVIQTGRRLAEPVELRAGGRVVARGELVNVEGELGVRVIELTSDGSA